MSQNILAAQLFTVRDFTKTLEDFSDTIAKISAIGYTAAQVSAIGPISPEDVKKICDDNGITIVNTHIAWERLKDDISSVIDEHKLWDCRHVAVGSMPRHFIEAGEEGLRQFIGEANEVGQTLHEAGLTFSYHNHSFEFIRYGDKNGLEILFEETDPRYVQAELDTFWIQFGGGDVCDWILRVKDRMPVVHGGRAFGPPLCGGIPPATPPRHHATLAPRRRRTVCATGRPPTSCREAVRRDHGRGRPCAANETPVKGGRPAI